MAEQMSKNAQKKLEKERKKEEAKAARAANRLGASTDGSSAVASATPKDAVAHAALFGTLPLNRSETREGRVFSQVETLAAQEGNRVLLRGRIDSSSGKGNMCFVTLRQRIFTVQCVVCKSDTIPKEMVKFAQGLTHESIIDIEGLVQKAEAGSISSCTVQQHEVRVEKLFLVSAAAIMPIQVADCSVPAPVFAAQKKAQAELDARIAALEERKVKGEDVDAELKKVQVEKETMAKRVKVSKKLRLDNRVIDLRTRANNAIFRIRAGTAALFREFLSQRNFVDIQSPKILGSASEGGASVFKFKYFEKPACLAQSPQFYKQMAIAADFGGVYEIGPVFRAEDSHTRRHLCEFNGLDLEMAFNEHYHEVTDVIGQLFVFMFDNLPKRYAAELAAVNDQYPFTPIRYSNPPKRFVWPEVIQMLRDAGETIGDLDDISTPQETKLGEIIAEKYGLDFYWCDKYPANIRPFYTMVDPSDPNVTNSYDWFVRGWEIISGAQRIHEPEMLTQRAIAKGVDPASIKEYIDAFRYGCPPHAGCGVGLERLVMLYLGLKDIRQTSLFPRDPERIAP